MEMTTWISAAELRFIYLRCNIRLGLPVEIINKLGREKVHMV